MSITPLLSNELISYASTLDANQKYSKVENIGKLPLQNILKKYNNNINFMVIIVNDGWFGNSIGPDQHFAKSIFRAIENNTFLVRAVFEIYILYFVFAFPADNSIII